MVDEYKTPTVLQSSILLALKPTGRGLTVVGDDAQSIYFPFAQPSGAKHPGLSGPFQTVG